MRINLFNNNKSEIIACVFFLITGIIAGSFLAAGLDKAKYTELYNYLDGFFTIFKNHNPDHSGIFYDSINYNMIYFFALTVCGVSVILVPLIPILLGARGMTIGFVSTFSLKAFGSKGFAFCFSNIFIKEMIMIPVLIIISALGIRLFRRVFFKRDIGIRVNPWHIIVVILVCIAMIILAASAEAYVSPAILRIIISE